MDAVYGTPQPLDLSGIKAKDRNNHLPVHLQEARDEQGRRRFHGAFTGGFSAGYFNTVGSKEGWKPTDYVSSRANRQTRTHAPENYMDEEDFEDYRKVTRINPEYDESNQRLLRQKHELDIQSENDSSFPAAQILAPAVIGIMHQPIDSLATNLLKAFGWGRHAQSDRLIDEIPEPKGNTGRQGLGYDPGTLYDPHRVPGQSGLPSRFEDMEPRAKRSKVLSFSLFDDDDIIYSSNSKSSYNQCIYSESKTAQKMPDRGQLDSRGAYSHPDSRGAHTGRVYTGRGEDSVAGFVVSLRALNPGAPPPRVKVPDDYMPKAILSLRLRESVPDGKNSANAAQLSNVLGDVRKSVFSYLSADSQKRLAEYLSNSIKSTSIRKQFSDGVLASKNSVIQKAVIDAQTARSALSGYIPFEDDPSKRDRYFKFLVMHTKEKVVDIKYPDTLSSSDISHEIDEFTKAATMFRSVNPSIAARFTSAKTPQAPSPSKAEVPVKPQEKPLPESTQAALAGVYGPFTRSIRPFYPDKLLSKRFNTAPIKTPQHPAAPQAPQFSPGIYSQRPENNADTDSQYKDISANPEFRLDYSLVKEVGKPSIDIFKAIFGDTAPGTESQKPASKPPNQRPQSLLDISNCEDVLPTKKKAFSPAAFRPIFKCKSDRSS